jgi:uncharacterized membrane protein
MPARLRIRIVGVALASLAYVLGCHWLMTRADSSDWDVVGVLAPMLVLLAIGAWRAGQRILAGVAALVLAGLCGQAVLGIRLPPHLLYLAQHVGIHLFLAAGFGATLRAGRTPLITTLATRVHGRITPGMAAYTRNLTAVWAGYFVAMAALSVALHEFASFDAWAWFANLLTPLAVVTMFGAEHLLRYRLHPEFERSTIADAVRSYLHGAKPAVPAAAQRDPVV